ncbi:hypothetical protein Tco_0068093 [Tanacetum coccineum]
MIRLILLFLFLNNSLPEFESFSDHTKETRSGSTTTHANYSLPEYESFHFDNPSFPHPPSEPSDVEICLHFKPDAPVINNFNELNDDQRGRVKIRSLTLTSPLRAGGISSGWNFHDSPDFEDSRAHGFVHLFELHILSFI